MSEVLLRAQAIRKVYKTGKAELEILKGLDLSVQRGEALCIVGSSGAGKSTLLHILGTLDSPTTGEVFFEGKSLAKKTDDELSLFRNQTLGFVFQFHYLLPEFSALENVMLPARLGGDSKKEARSKAEGLLIDLGLGHRLEHVPSELSGGEQQRVAIARALVQSPRVLLADEPTGNLDTETGAKIRELFFELRKERNLTLIVVTHDMQWTSGFDRVLRMKDGLWAI